MACCRNKEIFDLNSIAKKFNIPQGFLHKLFQKLSRAGIVNSHRGRNGGFSLAKDPSEISLGSIIEVLQGPILFNHCLEEKNICDRSGACSFQQKLNVLQEDVADFFKRNTLKDLADTETSLAEKTEKEIVNELSCSPSWL
jgi:Rrf2 family protein